MFKSFIDKFHKFYYDSCDKLGWSNTSWMGVTTQKCPLDLWVYQEIIFGLKPDAIVETGTFNGGSALFMASVCDMVGKGHIITIDIEKRQSRPQHERITYLLGSSISPEIEKEVESRIKSTDTVLVILDSDHRKDQVLRELEIYSRFVNKGSFLIVEDTNMNGHPVSPTFGPGPMEAVREFMRDNSDFVIDRTKEKFFLTFNPNGYLKRVK